jgi:hypothetical protein
MLALGVVVIVAATLFAFGRYSEVSWLWTPAILAGAGFTQTAVFLMTVDRSSGYMRGDDLVVMATPAFLILAGLAYGAGVAWASASSKA